MRDHLGTPVHATVMGYVILSLLIGGAWGDGYLSARAAHGGLAGLSIAMVVLTTAHIVRTRIRGGPDA